MCPPPSPLVLPRAVFRRPQPSAPMSSRLLTSYFHRRRSLPLPSGYYVVDITRPRPAVSSSETAVDSSTSTSRFVHHRRAMTMAVPPSRRSLPCRRTPGRVLAGHHCECIFSLVRRDLECPQSCVPALGSAYAGCICECSGFEPGSSRTFSQGERSSPHTAAIPSQCGLGVLIMNIY